MALATAPRKFRRPRPPVTTWATEEEKPCHRETLPIVVVIVLQPPGSTEPTPYTSQYTVFLPPVQIPLFHFETRIACFCANKNAREHGALQAFWRISRRARAPHRIKHTAWLNAAHVITNYSWHTWDCSTDGLNTKRQVVSLALCGGWGCGEWGLNFVVIPFAGHCAPASFSAAQR
mgnify:CR=1 FL=1